MIFNQEKTAVIFLDENKLILYLARTGQFFTLNFPSNIMSDLEIKDKPQFIKLLENFIQQNRIPPSTIIIAISDNLCLSRDIPSNDSKIVQISQLFIDSVPFETVGSVGVSKLLVGNSTTTKETNPDINKQTVTTIIATNKDIYDTIQNVLETKDFEISHIFPWSVLTVLGLTGKTTIDQATVQFILNNVDMLKNYNFPIDIKPKASSSFVQLTPSTPSSTKTTIILVGVFIVLLIVLVILVITRLRPPNA